MPDEAYEFKVVQFEDSSSGLHVCQVDQSDQVIVRESATEAE